MLVSAIVNAVITAVRKMDNVILPLKLVDEFDTQNLASVDAVPLDPTECNRDAFHVSFTFSDWRESRKFRRFPIVWEDVLNGGISMSVPTLIAKLLMSFSAAIAFASAYAQGDHDPVPVQKGETIRKGDLLVTRMSVALNDGQRTNEMEASSFEAMSSKPVLDKCRFEIVKSEKKYADDEQNFPSQALDSVRVKTDMPDFDMIAFIGKLKPSATEVFDEVVDIDDLAGPVFKREDLKEKLRLAFLAEPYTLLPRSTLSSVEQAITMHVWGYWGDVQKLKGKDYQTALTAKGNLRTQWIGKLADNVRDYLKEEARGRIQSMKSDQLTKTKVVLNFNFRDDGGAAQSRLECWFEGEKAKLTLQRLNAVIGPYFELVPKTRYVREAAAAAPKKRGVAVDGQGISSK